MLWHNEHRRKSRSKIYSKWLFNTTTICKSNLNTCFYAEVSIIQLSPSTAKGDPPAHEAIDFEAAISKTGFGWFNVFVIFTCVMCCISSMVQTTSMSMVFPRAQCDLDLSLADRGALNSAVYVGMILSAIFWGFLSDVTGRRKILFYGQFGTLFFDLFSALSQNFWVLAFGKFCGGFMWDFCKSCSVQQVFKFCANHQILWTVCGHDDLCRGDNP